MITSQFKPIWWLNNAHLQTIFPFVFRRQINLPLQRERVELSDGDFLDLDWLGKNEENIVLLLHGLGGSINSVYITGIMQAIHRQGFTSVLMHFRGCSGEPNRLPRSYHSGETEDLAFVIRTIMNRYPKAKLALVGYSLGGNVLLKYLGETKISDFIQCAVAVSVPFDLHDSVKRIQQGFSKIYQYWLLRNLKHDILKKAKTVSLPIELHNLKNLNNFQDFDQLITAPLHGFTSADDYYSQSSSRQFLKHIQVPTLIIHSLDDPFISHNGVPSQQELSENINLELSSSGGHVGFISDSKYHKPHYWLEERILVYLNQYFTVSCPARREKEFI